MDCFDSRLSIVIITFNRVAELTRTLARLEALPGRPQVVVVDNASSDGTSDVVEREFPNVRLIRAPANLGAAGRTLGAQSVNCPFIAFCDDDTWWAPHSLERASKLLEEHPSIAILTGRILVGEENIDDPICRELERSPVPSAPGVPGTPLVGFIAGASVVRRSAFLEAGGFNPRLFIGGEEGLLALDLLAKGWTIRYVPDLVVHHHPSKNRDAAARSRYLIRNELWLSWLRRPAVVALRKTLEVMSDAVHDTSSRQALAAACSGLPWVLAQRRVVSPEVERSLRLVEERSRD